MANTKLTPQQKADRKHIKAVFESQDGEKLLAFFPAYGVTVLIRRTGEEMGEFTVAIASPNESKARRKVGEYVALERWYYQGQSQPAIVGKFTPLEDVARDIAVAVSGN